MNEYPILFSTDMVKAILDGRKTMTRQVVKDLAPDFPHGAGCDVAVRRVGDYWCLPTSRGYKKSPYGGIGDLLWVRETHYQWGYWIKSGFTSAGRQKWRFVCDDIGKIAYLENPPEGILTGFSNAVGWYKRNSIHMPRWASHITLKVTGVRVERVRDISEADARAEGTIPSGVGADLAHLKYRAGFQTLWDTINAKRGYNWDSNPWVWVVEFTK